jgi:NADH-quinone oxidoreductase subunit G
VSDAEPTRDPNTVDIKVDGRPVVARKGEMLIAAAERAGTYIPRFCYHPRMESVGMCRMCLVEVEGPRGSSLQVSCMVPVTDGLSALTTTDTVKKAQEGVLEFLLANHPLDCPVCDKGGECPLQDQAFSHGPGESRFVEEKRHFEKPIPISPLVFLDRERCILCDRCTRFAKDVAGDPLISFTHRGNETQILTFPEHPFSSYFSGNTVQICPVGALTAKPYRFKARPWDLDQTESTCTTCSVGCRIVIQASRDRLLRYQGVDSDPVNWGWLCDKGRFGFEAVDSPQRLGAPLIRREGELRETTWNEALDAAAAMLSQALNTEGPGGVALLGGARGTNEDAYAWAKLFKGVLGVDNVDCQLGDGLPAELVLGLPPATIDQACSATTVVLLGPDLKEELPVLFLRLRDAAARRRTRVIEISPRASGMTPHAAISWRCRPGEQPAMVRALLGNGDANAVGVSGDELAEARTQLALGSVVVVLGRSSLAEPDSHTVAAASLLRAGLPEARFLVALRRGNVRGAIEMGLSPGVVPGGVALDDAGESLRRAWPNLPAGRGMDAAQILEAAAGGRVGCLVLLGADPLSDVPDRDLARRALSGARTVIAVDTMLNASSRHAGIVLAAAAFAEKSGTTTNLEGRVTNLGHKVTAKGTARADWMIAVDLAARLGADLRIDSAATAWSEICAVAPSHEGLGTAALAAAPDGLVSGATTSVDLPAVPAPDVPLANAYSYRLVSSRQLYDGGVALSASPSLAGLAGRDGVHLAPQDAAKIGVAGGDEVRVTSPRTSVILPVTVDPGLPRGAAWVPWNQPGSAVADLIDGEAVTDVNVETL